MEKTNRTPCLHSSAEIELYDICKEKGWNIPEVYLHEKMMAELAEEIKRRNRDMVCVLPFCHTAEAEALGGSICYGNEKAGPRKKESVCSELKDVLQYGGIDFSRGRIREILSACQSLCRKGEHVVLQVSGPFTILSLLTESQSVFRALHREPEILWKVCQKIGQELTVYIQKAKEQGVEMVSYADAAAGPEILGPKRLGQVTENFTYPFLKELEEKMGESLLVILCPKTAGALLEQGYALTEQVRMPEGISFGEGCIRMIGNAGFCGQMCFQGRTHPMKDDMFQVIKLK